MATVRVRTTGGSKAPRGRTLSSQTVKYADAKDVKAAASSWPLGFLNCRQLGHGTWRFVSEQLVEGAVYDETNQCPECGTLRTQSMSAVTGIRIGNYRYTHPDGYIVKDLGRLDGESRGLLWLERRNRRLLARKGS